MPWSNQSGGPWGSGPRGPWGSGPQSQGPKPPDLEEFLRRSQDRLRGLLPGSRLRNFSWLRRRNSSRSGGLGPCDCGPEPHGPFDPEPHGPPG